MEEYMCVCGTVVPPDYPCLAPHPPTLSSSVLDIYRARRGGAGAQDRLL